VDPLNRKATAAFERLEAARAAWRTDPLNQQRRMQFEEARNCWLAASEAAIAAQRNAGNRHVLQEGPQM